MKILLIDDDMDDTLLFRKVVSDINHAIYFLSAQDGKEALEYLQSGQPHLPDLIFLDLNMPRMNGKECLQLLKKDPLLKDIPVIIYTTSSLLKDKQETIAAGAICFITKPSSISDLKKILLVITAGFPERMEEALRGLSNTGNHFVAC
jgi:CheY-like chemotaxis protein